MLSMCHAISQREAPPDHVFWNPHREHKLFTDYSIFNTWLQNTPNYCISSEQGFPILWFSDRQSHAAICGINNLIIRNTEFTIQTVVPFVYFVFTMSIWFSYYCRIGQHSNTAFSPNETVASVNNVRFTLLNCWALGEDLFKLQVLLCRWIKHVCTFQYREHPCYTRDLANHSLLSKRLHRIGYRRLLRYHHRVYRICYELVTLHFDLWPVNYRYERNFTVWNGSTWTYIYIPINFRVSKM